MSIVDKLSTIKTNTTLVYNAGVEEGIAQGDGSVNLDAEIATQDELIAELNSILDTKASGGGGGEAETCTVTMNLPERVAILGYGHVKYYFGTTLLGEYDLPSTRTNSHFVPINITAVFESIPVGSVFSFYNDSGTITSAATSDSIEFGLINATANAYERTAFAACRCNGDGTITINVG